MESEFKKLYTFQNENTEYYTEKQDVTELIEYLEAQANWSKQYKIWCPFDSNESEFVKQFKNKGYNVIHTHIDDGFDFYKMRKDIDFDIIVSNPPFKQKRITLEKIMEFAGNETKWILLFGIQCWNSGGFTKKFNEFNRPQLLMKGKRIGFNYLKTKPTFHCHWLGNNFMDKDIDLLDRNWGNKIK